LAENHHRHLLHAFDFLHEMEQSQLRSWDSINIVIYQILFRSLKSDSSLSIWPSFCLPSVYLSLALFSPPLPSSLPPLLSLVPSCSPPSLQFGDSQQLRLVRILRSTVMVRVGGGWMALDEFLVKNDPCRGESLLLLLLLLLLCLTHSH